MEEEVELGIRDEGGEGGKLHEEEMDLLPQYDFGENSSIRE